MINTITVLGNVGRDAEVKQIGKNTATEFSLAVSHGKDEQTSWFKVTSWDKWTAEHPPVKGQKVVVTGSIKLREYDKKDGSKGMSAEIRADRVYAINVTAPEDVNF